MIVGFAGAAGSGKDTAALALIEKMGYVKGSFAAPLKEMLNTLFGWQMSDWDSLDWKETPNDGAYGLTPRFVAQTFGTDWGRNTINEDLWVDAAVGGLANERTVFTDVRFPNEARAVRDAGGVILYVTCVDQAKGTSSNDHESEGWLEWLFNYADAEISAEFGYINELQSATLNVVDAYLRGEMPRFEPSAEAEEALAQIETKILRRMKDEH